MSDNNQGAFIAGFLIGGIAGAAAAILMTPQSGEKIRLQLQEKGIELKTQFGDLTTGIEERGRVIIEEKLPRSGSTSSEDVDATPADEAADDEEAA